MPYKDNIETIKIVKFGYNLFFIRATWPISTVFNTNYSWTKFAQMNKYILLQKMAIIKILLLRSVRFPSSSSLSYFSNKITQFSDFCCWKKPSVHSQLPVSCLKVMAVPQLMIKMEVIMITNKRNFISKANISFWIWRVALDVLKHNAS